VAAQSFKIKMHSRQPALSGQLVRDDNGEAINLAAGSSLASSVYFYERASGAGVALIAAQATITDATNGHVAYLGLALIAKDEADTLPRLLASIEGAFDEVVLVDTGSTDRTRTVFREWAERRRPATRLPARDRRVRVVRRLRRRPPFADSLSSADWLSWADCDDEITGAHNIRALAANTPDHVTR
jgi:hypothetical protein